MHKGMKYRWPNAKCTWELTVVVQLKIASNQISLIYLKLEVLSRIEVNQLHKLKSMPSLK